MHTKCISLSNQKCMIQPTLINLYPNEYIARYLTTIYYLSSAVYILLWFTWIELDMYFPIFTLKMINTCSDEIQTLIESKVENKFK